MSKYLVYGFILSVFLLLIGLYYDTLPSSLSILDGSRQSEGKLEETGHQSQCHRLRRASKRPPCPQYYNVTLSKYLLPSFQFHIICDRSKKSTCRSKCVEMKEVDIPKLKLLGMKMKGNTPVYYYQKILDEATYSCLCI